MIQFKIKCILLFIMFVTFCACKKKTIIKVKLFNPALNEYVANATVVLVQKNEGGGIFSSSASCEEIAEAITNANGIAVFSDEKLKGGNKEYFCAVKKSWGLDQDYPCDGKTSGFIEIGETSEQTIVDEANGFFQIQYNNLLNPSQSGDSLIVSLTSIEYSNPDGSVTQGNGGVFGNYSHYGDNGFPYASSWILNPIKTKGQRLKRTIRKRKMGVVTTSIDTVKVYPNQTTTININW